MKNHSSITSRTFDDNSQYNSDESTNSNSDNTQNSNSNFSLEHRTTRTVAAGKDDAGNNVNIQPVSLDLSINAPILPLSNALLSRAFATFDNIGVHSGVPTRTTPTLTPTTLKNIEQTFIDATNDTPINLPYQAGFVPPSYPMEEHSQDGGVSPESLSSISNGSWHVSGSHGYTGDDLDSKSSTSMEQPPSGTLTRRSTFATNNLNDIAKSEDRLMDAVSSCAIGSITGRALGPIARSSGRRNVGGRRPHKPSNLTPEEEEKRRIRRERNKQAAARCRRRREDHTNELVDETDQLEKKRQSLTQEIQLLQQEKDDLEFLLESHRAHCRMQARRASIDLKPSELENIATFVLPKIKTEPEEEFCHQQQNQHGSAQLQDHLHSELNENGTISKKLKLSNIHCDSLETPTPSNSAFIPLNGNAFAGTKPSSGNRPARPDSLDVKSATQYPLMARGDAGGPVGISTPSSGLFNFDSLMEGGTGLTPIAAPISFPSNRNPLELITPTSTEPSKLCSL